ncbi:ATP-binding cassette domain-containing protein [Cytobacillus solani]|uniref:Multidrug ABC transporter ATP-binding protein n=1 Tax=Cytobacillus solani TaxID=1637975 RepID=A0A0Q3VI24_9BACI|nr:ABC transporter ATP-binding protein [Cytobacillus solani]KOP82747.1 multidrug ABC transporter ATP-binding protein [Bacillus sp. FJAT-21945]KQL19767.1 multidrug ABC transporter ATP-binding protein [Cytobacillus solani]USK52999.1 ABC transporter ATP-binding protein [Cytobacillus solani]
MINVKDLSFSYGHTPALTNVNLLEEEPIIVGLWGRNGAGKTTLMKLLSGQEKPDTGQILVKNLSPYNNSDGMKYISYLQENHPFSEFWNVNDALRFASYFNENWDQDLAEELVERFELPRRKKIKSFSKGMQTMTTMVIGLASKSPITIMDEPTNGLDAYMRKVFYDALLDTHEEHPRLFILSSHHIDEIEPICEKIAIVDKQTITHYDETEHMKMLGILLTGDASSIEPLTARSRILEQRKLGNQLSVMLDEPFNEEWISTAAQMNINIEKAPLQDYLVNITKRNKEAKRK